MSEPHITKEQSASPAQHISGRLLLIVGGVMLFLGFYVSAFLIPDVIQALGGPQSVTLQNASLIAGVERTYVRFEDGNWDCETLTPVRGFSPSYRRYEILREETKFTEIFFIDDTRETVVLVTLSGEVNCDELIGEAPSGYLYAMSDSTRQELTNDARLAQYFNADSFLEFCGYCGRDNSIIGAIFGVVFTFGGVSLMILGRKLQKAERVQGD